MNDPDLIFSILICDKIRLLILQTDRKCLEKDQSKLSSQKIDKQFRIKLMNCKHLERKKFSFKNSFLSPLI